MKFYIQQNISEKDVQELINVFDKHNIQYQLFYHIPFDDSYPEIDETIPAFVYAASSVTDKVYNDYKTFMGVFAHTNDINLETFFNNSPELMWNEPLYMGKFKDFIITENEIFIRPLIDSKWIAGTVLTSEEFTDWKNKLEKIDFDFNENIFVSKIHMPKEEYRLFYVNHSFSTGSQYKKDYEQYKNNFVPNNIVDIANQFVEKNKIDLPKSFVVDVGLDENHIGIIEVNGINNAGFYSIDKEKLVLDLIGAN